MGAMAPPIRPPRLAAGRDLMSDTNRPAPDPAAFPTDGSLAARAAFLLQYAVLAPSSHNSQPWLFTVDDVVRTLSE